MPLFLSDEEYARCSHDPSLISQKADAFITQLYNQLHTKNAQYDASSITIGEDGEIDRLELRKVHNELEADMPSKDDTCNTLKWKDDRIKELESKLEALQNELRSSKDTAAAPQEQLSSKEVYVNMLFEPDFILFLLDRAQFHGLPDEDPYRHIANFLLICSALKPDEARDDAIRLRLFPFSLRDKALLWFDSLPDGSITTWDTMADKFVSKYFPPSKKAKLRRAITDFLQMDGESLYEAWERFKELLQRCPHHGIQLSDQVQIFYDGLFDHTRQEINVVVLTSKTPEAAFDLIEKMAIDTYYWEDRRNKPSRQDDAYTSLSAQLEALAHKVDQMQVKALQVSCEVCGGPHPSRDCEQQNMFASREDVDYTASQVPYNNNYNMSGRNHPNSSWQVGSSNQTTTYQLEECTGRFSSVMSSPRTVTETFYY